MAAVLLGAPERSVVSHSRAARLWGLAIPLQRPDEQAWPDRKVLVEFDGNVHQERDVFVILGRPAEVIAAIRAALGL